LSQASCPPCHPTNSVKALNSEYRAYVTCSAQREEDWRDRDKPVDVTLLLLSIAPDSSHRLVVIGRVPVRVKHHQTTGSDEVEATPTRLAAQHEDELATLMTQ